MGKNLLYGMLALSMMVTQVNAVKQWYSAGLKGDTINCLAVDDSGSVLAGCESGLFVYRDKWYAIKENSLPVNDILVTGPGRFVFVCGKGSDSDGLYQADLTSNTPPFYSVDVVGFMDVPQRLGKTPSGDVVYAGNGQGVSYSILDTGGSGYVGLYPMKIPQHPFGVENPVCGGIQVYSVTTTVFAGGYDRSPEPGPASLLWGSGDSLRVFRMLDVTAITEGVVDWGGVKVFFGTPDSGIFVHASVNSFPPRKFCDAPAAGPVLDIVVDILDGGGLLVAAAKSGVYQYHTSGWTALGSIPAEPLCLMVKRTGPWVNAPVLFAGTYNGVYAYDTAAVDIEHNTGNVQSNKKSLFFRQYGGLITVGFTLEKRTLVSVRLLDAAGRKIRPLYRGICDGGMEGTSVDCCVRVGTGIYIIEVETAEFRSYGRVFIY